MAPSLPLCRFSSPNPACLRSLVGHSVQLTFGGLLKEVQNNLFCTVLSQLVHLRLQTLFLLEPFWLRMFHRRLRGKSFHVLKKKQLPVSFPPCGDAH